MSTPYPLIPYGWADFRAIRLERRLYVDKTHFIRPLENERFTFLIRPRRFGKSCWVSLLENYYDRKWAGEFEQVFGGTSIGSNPTANRHSFVVVRFDFSVVNDAPETLEREFDDYCGEEIGEALERNADLIPADATRRILNQPSASAKLNVLFREARRRDIRLFILIDEYDSLFMRWASPSRSPAEGSANPILAHHGADAYQELTHGSSFYRNFFSVLKDGAGRSGGGLERLFITGVSPITLDDVTGGFNIGKNISLWPEFNAILGFTEAEVSNLLRTYHEAGALDLNPNAALDVMREWYDGYRFARNANETVYNTDMVLYFLDAVTPNKPMPDDLIDVNVRTDYTKLRHLLTVSRQMGPSGQPAQENAPRPEAPTEARRLNGNFDLLRHVISEGQADADLQTSFPLERLDQRDNFLSLLHYFGLLSIREAQAGTVTLGIPNETVRRLLYGHLRDAYDDVGVLSVDMHAFARLLRRMALHGEWQPVFDFLKDAITAQTSIRDYLEGEKVIQGFLAAYLGVSRHFLVRTEAELNKGFADIVLEPLVAQYPELRCGYFIEIKYIKRYADDGIDSAAVREAERKLQCCLVDERWRLSCPSTRFIGLILLFDGTKIWYYEVPVGGPITTSAARTLIPLRRQWHA